MKTLFSSVLAITLIVTYFTFIAFGTLCAQTVSIGNQEWMMHNLDADTFRNGEPIPEAQSKKEWKEAGRNKQAAWCYHEFDTANKNHGRLYNWYAVADSSGLCPAGWHVPTNHDWNLMMKNLNADSDTINCDWKSLGCQINSSGSMKDETVLWYSFLCLVERSTNSSGFTALPGGYQFDFAGPVTPIGHNGYWWTSTEFSGTSAWFRNLYFSEGSGLLSKSSTYFKASGYSVRCLKD